MKVQTLVLAASAALILSAQGVAQSDTGLERALTELNAGLTAPVGSASMAISGDARIRNAYTVGGDKKAIDTRARLNFDFNVNESVSASIGASFYEDWDGADMGSGDNNFNRYTVSASNLLGDGGSFTAGTQYFTLGSGRVIGSDDWDNANQATSTGIWYDNAGFSLFFLEGDDGAGNDVDTFGLTFDYALNVPGIGDINLLPYLLGGMVGEPGSTAFSTDIYGSEFSGSAMGMAWSGEYATDGDTSAWTASTSIDIASLASVPGVSSASLDLSFSSADENWGAASGTGDNADNALTWNQAGLNSGALWSFQDVSTAGVSFSPMEGWNGRLTRIDRDGNTAWNISASTTLGGAVDMWVGYDNTDGGVATDDTFWMTMSINF